jgi:hypothetical protein
MMSISLSNSEKIVDPATIGRLYSIAGKPARNYYLPVHRWFRFPAGFAADFIDGILKQFANEIDDKPILDPFGGIATSLICARRLGFNSVGVEAHPLFYHIGKTKLQWDVDLVDLSYAVEEFVARITRGVDSTPGINTYPALVRKCFPIVTLKQFDAAVESLSLMKENSDEAVTDFLWLGLVAIVRKVSHCCTSPWQYVLPNKKKTNHLSTITALRKQYSQMLSDLSYLQEQCARPAKSMLVQGDARTLSFLDRESVSLAICSPPYLNNFDYSDATRLESYVLRDAGSWADITRNVRSKLITSATTQVKRAGFDPEAMVGEIPRQIRTDLLGAIKRLTAARKDKGGKKNYDIVVCRYFIDMSIVLKEMARVLETRKLFIMMVGDSAPYGIYIPTDEWLAKLALNYGFSDCQLIRLRNRNDRWNNRKHRIPLRESLVLLPIHRPNLVDKTRWAVIISCLLSFERNL